MTIRMHYDRAEAAAYLRFSEEPVVVSEEVSEGVVIDYDVQRTDGRHGSIVGQEKSSGGRPSGSGEIRSRMDGD